jgi:hypothetical protein
VEILSAGISDRSWLAFAHPFNPAEPRGHGGQVVPRREQARRPKVDGWGEELENQPQEKESS